MNKLVSNTKKYYKKRISDLGNGNDGVLWAEKERQTVRFDKALSALNFSGKSVLDVGCGYADFYKYCTNLNIGLKHYTGIDFISEFIEFALKDLGKTKNVHLIVGDILKDVIIKKHDIVVVSGTLNYFGDQWIDIANAMCEKIWSLATESIIFNIKSPHSSNSEFPWSPQQAEAMHPQKWCQFAHDKTASYAIYHDYVYYDYTVVMNKSGANHL